MFWTNYAYLCDTVGKSPNKVASELGVSSSGTVTKWKAEGSIPRDRLLFRISEYFDVSVDALLHSDLRAEKKPSLKIEEERKMHSALGLDDLTDEELRQVASFVAGIKATRALH